MSRPSHQAKRSPRIEWPDWLDKAIQVFKPPENITVSEYADKHRILDSKTSNESGKWRTTRTPYLKGIMDAFNDPDIEEIIFCKPTQVGGTEGLNNIIAWIIAQDPSPTMIVYPTDILAQFTSENRLRPMVELIPSLRDKFWRNESKQLELQFDEMYIALSGANSPSSLASKPIRFLLMDEVDKFPISAGKEADPRSLARERTKTFPYNKKIFQTSTPTYKSAPIWNEWENADQQLKYFVPCPHCGHKQVFEFRQIKYNNASPDMAQQTARYECIECQGIITDGHKADMLRNGTWQPIKKTGTKKTAFHLNAIYSPWIRFGEMAYEYERSKDEPELFMNFINSWLAQPWEQTEVKMNTDIVLERQSEYKDGEVPPDTIMLTGGIDVQKNHFYWTIRAWGKRITSWNVAHGKAESFEEIEDIMNRSYFDASGKEYIVNIAGMDSGDQTDEVYEFCFLNSDWCKPVKGASNPILNGYKESTIDKKNSKANGMTLYLVDGAFYKDRIAAKLNKPNGPSSWMVYNGCDRKYAEMITAEEKIKLKSKAGTSIYIWQPKPKSENHYLDCEVYAMAVAYINGILTLGVEEEHKPQEEQKKQHHNNDDNYINAQDDWIPRKDGWV